VGALIAGHPVEGAKHVKLDHTPLIHVSVELPPPDTPFGHVMPVQVAPEVAAGQLPCPFCGALIAGQEGDDLQVRLDHTPLVHVIVAVPIETP